MLGLGNSITGGAALDDFTPANIANLALWLKQGTGITSDGGTPDKVSQWNDSSGNDNHAAQSTSGNQADLVGTGTDVGLDFEENNADNYDLTSKITMSQDHNFIIGFVITPENPAANRNCVLGDDNNEFVDFQVNTVAINCSGTETTYVGDSALFSDGTKAAVVISRNDGSTGTFNVFINGATPAGSYFGGIQANPKAVEFDEIGVRNGSGRPFDGILHELVVYDFGTGTHTASELTALNNYFTSKFGL
tara:strand:- start:1087 stop:1833 length:747 start_codon:yes stop_codon:yes gene_type:complete